MAGGYGRWMRRAVGATLAVAVSISAAAARAQEVTPSVADVEIGADRLTMEVRLSVEPILAGIDLSGATRMKALPRSDVAARYRALPPGELTDIWRARWSELRQAIRVRAGDVAVPVHLAGLSVPQVGDVGLPRDSRLQLLADLPDDGSAVTLGWAAEWGPLIVRRDATAGDGRSAILSGGAMTQPMARRPPPMRDRWLLPAAALCAALAAWATVAWRRRRGAA